MAGPPPTDAEVMQALADLLASDIFTTNSRLPRLLRYLVLSTVEGRGATLKAYVIATEALGRGEEFDPATDSIVRVEVNRLRQCLAHYYATEGVGAGLVIDIPKGQYRPVFLRTAPTPLPTAPKAPHRNRWRGQLAVAVVAILCVAAAAVAWQLAGPDDSGQPAVAAVAVTDDAALGSAESPADARPPFPRLYTAAGSEAPVLEMIMLAIQNVASRFDTVRVMTRAAAPDDVVWPEDYQIEVSALAGETGVTVFLRLIHLSSGELVESREVLVSGLEHDALDLENRLAVQRETARFAGYGGGLEQDYRRRGDWTATMRCALLLQDYFAARSDASHLAARDCAEAEIGAGNREPYLYTALAMLLYEEHVDRRNPRLAEADRAALRTAQSAISRNPGSAQAHLAQMLALGVLGDREGVARSGNKAVELNPFAAEVAGLYGLLLGQSGHYTRALELLRRSEELQADGRPWRDYGFFLAHYGLRRFDVAERHTRTLAESGDPHHLAAALVAALVAGEQARASELASRLAALDVRFAADPGAAYASRGFASELAGRLVADLAAAGLPEAVAAAGE